MILWLFSLLFGNLDNPAAFWTNLKDSLHSRCEGKEQAKLVNEATRSRCRTHAPQQASLWAHRYCLAATALALEVLIELIMIGMTQSFSNRNHPLSVKRAMIFLFMSFWVLVTLFSQITVKVRHLCSTHEFICTFAL